MSGIIHEDETGRPVAFFDSFGNEPRRTPGQKFKRSNWDNREKYEKPGWVYLFAIPDEWMVPLYKIGLSSNPIRRASQISKQFSGWTVMIAACFKTDNMARDEERLLEMFAEYRTNGGDEYFTLGTEQLVQFSEQQKHPFSIHLSHYPMGEWDRAYHGGWHLHGHSHGKYKGDNHLTGEFCWDVGVDGNGIGFTPISFGGILEWAYECNWGCA